MKMHMAISAHMSGSQDTPDLWAASLSGQWMDTHENIDGCQGNVIIAFDMKFQWIQYPLMILTRISPLWSWSERIWMLTRKHFAANQSERDEMFSLPISGSFDENAMRKFGKISLPFSTDFPPLLDCCNQFERKREEVAGWQSNMNDLKSGKINLKQILYWTN